jgi:hypothetical protein
MLGGVFGFLAHAAFCAPKRFSRCFFMPVIVQRAIASIYGFNTSQRQPLDPDA